ncbi:hypothetical protein SNEBB_008258 [Seison nebaliae]|nr:hypothetical protein SNEBB_008258 [Seison nebaliae]
MKLCRTTTVRHLTVEELGGEVKCSQKKLSRRSVRNFVVLKENGILPTTNDRNGRKFVENEEKLEIRDDAKILLNKIQLSINELELKDEINDFNNNILHKRNDNIIQHYITVYPLNLNETNHVDIELRREKKASRTGRSIGDSGGGLRKSETFPISNNRKEEGIRSKNKYITSPVSSSKSRKRRRRKNSTSIINKDNRKNYLKQKEEIGLGKSDDGVVREKNLGKESIENEHSHLRLLKSSSIDLSIDKQRNGWKSKQINDTSLTISSSSSTFSSSEEEEEEEEKEEVGEDEEEVAEVENKEKLFGRIHRSTCLSCISVINTMDNSEDVEKEKKDNEDDEDDDDDEEEEEDDEIINKSSNSERMKLDEKVENIMKIDYVMATKQNCEKKEEEEGKEVENVIEELSSSNDMVRSSSQSQQRPVPFISDGVTSSVDDDKKSSLLMEKNVVGNEVEVDQLIIVNKTGLQRSSNNQQHSMIQSTTSTASSSISTFLNNGIEKIEKEMNEILSQQQQQQLENEQIAYFKENSFDAHDEMNKTFYMMNVNEQFDERSIEEEEEEEEENVNFLQTIRKREKEHEFEIDDVLNEDILSIKEQIDNLEMDESEFLFNCESIPKSSNTPKDHISTSTSPQLTTTITNLSPNTVSSDSNIRSSDKLMEIQEKQLSPDNSIKIDLSSSETPSINLASTFPPPSSTTTTTSISIPSSPIPTTTATTSISIPLSSTTTTSTSIPSSTISTSLSIPSSTISTSISISYSTTSCTSTSSLRVDSPTKENMIEQNLNELQKANDGDLSSTDKPENLKEMKNRLQNLQDDNRRQEGIFEIEQKRLRQLEEINRIISNKFDQHIRDDISLDSTVEEHNIFHQFNLNRINMNPEDNQMNNDENDDENDDESNRDETSTNLLNDETFIEFDSRKNSIMNDSYLIVNLITAAIIYLFNETSSNNNNRTTYRQSINYLFKRLNNLQIAMRKLNEEILFKSGTILSHLSSEEGNLQKYFSFIFNLRRWDYFEKNRKIEKRLNYFIKQFLNSQQLENDEKRSDSHFTNYNKWKLFCSHFIQFDSVKSLFSNEYLLLYGLEEVKRIGASIRQCKDRWNNVDNEIKELEIEATTERDRICQQLTDAQRILTNMELIDKKMNIEKNRTIIDSILIESSMSSADEDEEMLKDLEIIKTVSSSSSSSSSLSSILADEDKEVDEEILMKKRRRECDDDVKKNMQKINEVRRERCRQQQQLVDTLEFQLYEIEAKYESGRLKKLKLSLKRLREEKEKKEKRFLQFYNRLNSRIHRHRQQENRDLLQKYTIIEDGEILVLFFGQSTADKIKSLFNHLNSPIDDIKRYSNQIEKFIETYRKYYPIGKKKKIRNEEILNVGWNEEKNENNNKNFHQQIFSSFISLSLDSSKLSSSSNLISSDSSTSVEQNCCHDTDELNKSSDLLQYPSLSSSSSPSSSCSSTSSSSLSSSKGFSCDVHELYLKCLRKSDQQQLFSYNCDLGDRPSKLHCDQYSSDSGIRLQTVDDCYNEDRRTIGPFIPSTIALNTINASQLRQNCPLSDIMEAIPGKDIVNMQNSPRQGYRTSMMNELSRRGTYLNQNDDINAMTRNSHTQFKQQRNLQYSASSSLNDNEVLFHYSQPITPAKSNQILQINDSSNILQKNDQDHLNDGDFYQFRYSNPSQEHQQHQQQKQVLNDIIQWQHNDQFTSNNQLMKTPSYMEQQQKQHQEQQINPIMSSQSSKNDVQLNQYLSTAPTSFSSASTDSMSQLMESAPTPLIYNHQTSVNSYSENSDEILNTHNNNKGGNVNNEIKRHRSQCRDFYSHQSHETSTINLRNRFSAGNSMKSCHNVSKNNSRPLTCYMPQMMKATKTYIITILPNVKSSTQSSNKLDVLTRSNNSKKRKTSLTISNLLNSDDKKVSNTTNQKTSVSNPTVNSIELKLFFAINCNILSQLSNYYLIIQRTPFSILRVSAVLLLGPLIKLSHSGYTSRAQCEGNEPTSKGFVSTSVKLRRRLSTHLSFRKYPAYSTSSVTTIGNQTNDNNNNNNNNSRLNKKLSSPNVLKESSKTSKSNSSESNPSSKKFLNSLSTIMNNLNINRGNNNSNKNLAVSSSSKSPNGENDFDDMTVYDGSVRTTTRSMRTTPSGSIRRMPSELNSSSVIGSGRHSWDKRWFIFDYVHRELKYFLCPNNALIYYNKINELFLFLAMVNEHQISSNECQPTPPPPPQQQQMNVQTSLLKSSNSRHLSQRKNENEPIEIVDDKVNRYYNNLYKSLPKPRGVIPFQDIADVFPDHSHSAAKPSPNPSATIVLKLKNHASFDDYVNLYLVAPNIEISRVWADIIFSGAAAYSY